MRPEGFPVFPRPRFPRFRLLGIGQGWQRKVLGATLGLVCPQLPPDPACKTHYPGKGHPEQLARYEAVHAALEAAGFCWQRQSSSARAPCLARAWSGRTSRAIWSWRRGRFAAATTTSALAIRTSARSRGTPRWRNRATIRLRISAPPSPPRKRATASGSVPAWTRYPSRSAPGRASSLPVPR